MLNKHHKYDCHDELKLFPQDWKFFEIILKYRCSFCFFLMKHFILSDYSSNSPIINLNDYKFPLKHLFYWGHTFLNM